MYQQLIGSKHFGMQAIWAIVRVPTSSVNHGKPGKSLKKSLMHKKVMEFEKKQLNNHRKIMEFCNNLTKPLVARKQCPTASFLATGGFKF